MLDVSSLDAGRALLTFCYIVDVRGTLRHCNCTAPQGRFVCVASQAKLRRGAIAYVSHPFSFLVVWRPTGGP